MVLVNVILNQFTDRRQPVDRNQVLGHDVPNLYADQGLLQRYRLITADRGLLHEQPDEHQPDTRYQVLTDESLQGSQDYQEEREGAPDLTDHSGGARRVIPPIP